MWSPFCGFDDEISNLLYHDWDTVSFLNEKYADRLAFLSEKELKQLPDLFSSLLKNNHYGEPTQLSKEKADLLRRVSDIAGELKISSVWGQAPLASFRSGIATTA